MTIKLIQKQFLKGSREIELAGDVVNVRIKKFLKEEKLTISLSTLNPEPVVNQPYLEFHGQEASTPVLSMLLNNPDEKQFNSFVDVLKQRVQQHTSTIAEVSESTKSAGIAANIYEEPPEFKEFGHNRLKTKGLNINTDRIGESIGLLEKFIDNEEIKPLLAALKALKAEPQNDACFEQMESAFNNLGIAQGAVLTYAPYLSVLLADDPFANG